MWYQEDENLKDIVKSCVLYHYILLRFLYTCIKISNNPPCPTPNPIKFAIIRRIIKIDAIK